MWTLYVKREDDFVKTVSGLDRDSVVRLLSVLSERFGTLEKVETESLIYFLAGDGTEYLAISQERKEKEFKLLLTSAREER